MSLFGSLLGDVEEDPFFGSHMRHMRQMHNMMNLFSNPFGMLGDGPLAITGPSHGSSLMPFMPQMPSLNRMFSDLSDGHMGTGSSFSSSTVVMSSGLNGNPQVYSSSSSTKIGPNGVKETRKTLQDSRTGVKKMSIGHHIGERAHVIEREQNYYSGDAEEHQEYINLEEDEAEDFDREFQQRAGMGCARSRPAITAAREPPARLALPAPPSPPAPAPAHAHAPAPAHASASATSSSSSRRYHPSARRALRSPAGPPAPPASSGVREVYGGAHPQRQRPRHRPHRNH